MVVIHARGTGIDISKKDATVCVLVRGPAADHEFWQDHWSILTSRQLNDATFALYDRESIDDRLGEVVPLTLITQELSDVSTPLERGVLVAEEVVGSRCLLLIEGGPHAVNLTHVDEVNAASRHFVSAITREHDTGTLAP